MALTRVPQRHHCPASSAEARADEETWALCHEFVLYFQGQVLSGDKNLLHRAERPAVRLAVWTYVEPVDVNLLSRRVLLDQYRHVIAIICY